LADKETKSPEAKSHRGNPSGQQSSFLLPFFPADFPSVRKNGAALHDSR
jgi:hypothetical protein